MMEMIDIVVMAIGAYLIAMMWLIYWWLKIPIQELNSSSNTEHIVSIIIPVRNEAKHIKRLLFSIVASNFPIKKYEIIVIDDCSSDQTQEEVKHFISVHDKINIKLLASSQRGKKQAIIDGVKYAVGQYMICTDGDSLVGKNWISHHYRAFTNGAMLSFGTVQYIGSSLVTNCLNLELAALVATGGATLQGGIPSMINGCNYAFHKPTFLELDGFTDNNQIATGDDEFLLRKFFKHDATSVCFLKNTEAMVYTNPPTSMSEFYHQRRRWASKWKHHREYTSKIIPLLVFLLYLILVVSSFYAVVNSNVTMLIYWLAKIGIDLLFIKIISNQFRLKIGVFSFILQQIYYPFYCILFGIVAHFGSYTWKGRTHKINPP